MSTSLHTDMVFVESTFYYFATQFYKLGFYKIDLVLQSTQKVNCMFAKYKKLTWAFVAIQTFGLQYVKWTQHKLKSLLYMSYYNLT